MWCGDSGEHAPAPGPTGRVLTLVVLGLPPGRVLTLVVLGLDLSKLLAELLVLAALHDDLRVADGAREAGVGHVAVELLRHALLTRQTQEQSVTGKQATAGTTSTLYETTVSQAHQGLFFRIFPGWAGQV